ncbi:unnamed protein product [Schistosoma curassoni]|uniref:Reverse transcriptase domain-containing protein n=1 Tax=Schistosoma curassoni TaxID=6186 RepID=A0A183KA76_9TREM|nr:unnamed protein product [Schistosoma curassoni]
MLLHQRSKKSGCPSDKSIVGRQQNLAIYQQKHRSQTKLTAKMLHVLFRKVWEEEQVPTGWKEEQLSKIPKKEDLNKCENYRDITLLLVPGKVLNRVLLNRMEDAVDAQIRGQQDGLRKDRLCTDQIATLRITAEQSVEWNSSLYINFIDYEKDLTMWIEHHGNFFGTIV